MVCEYKKVVPKYQTKPGTDIKVKMRKPIIPGDRFGRLQVIYRINDKVYSNCSRYPFFHCRCSCGKYIDVMSQSLTSGKTRSCGCLGKETSSIAGRNTFKDLTNKRFGRLTVIRRVDDKILPSEKHQTMFECKCDCGNIIITSSGRLMSGKTKSCGCLAKEVNSKNHFVDLTGQRFGRLVVIKRVDDHVTPSGRHIVMFQCHCDCGNITIVPAESLTNGNTRSCGCYSVDSAIQRNTIDIINKRFGRLTVVKQVETINHRTRFLCHCDCGSNVIVDGCNLRNGYTQSCGCLKSRGEAKISSILKNNGVNFCREYTCDNLIDVNKLRIDFAILNDEGSVQYFIEYDGEQHFYSKACGWSNDDQLRTTQKHDRIKNEYCFSHDIPLIRIPYTHYDNLCYADLVPETSDYLLFYPAAQQHANFAYTLLPDR